MRWSVSPRRQCSPTRVSRYANNAKAKNTRKAYRIDWDDFVLWCDPHGRSPMPATPETIVEYLEGLADVGAKVATLKRRLSSISVAHQMRGHEHDNPTRSGLVTTSMQGIRRTLGTAQTQKAPLVTAELTRLVAACEQLPHPLTAAGAVVAVPYGSHSYTCPVRSLRAWLALSGISEGPIWREIDRHGNLGVGRLHADSVARIIKRSCTLAGLDPPAIHCWTTPHPGRL